MKSIYRILPIVLFFIGCMGFSQTPEQQEMIDKALKMRDSIMQCMNLEEVLRQANEQEKRNNSNNKEESSSIKTEKSEDKYCKNTLASNNNNRLTNWNKGEANLVFNYRYDSRKDAIEYVKVGVIKSDGSIVLNPTY